jgi:hypothetical protein
MSFLFDKKVECPLFGFVWDGAVGEADGGQAGVGIDAAAARQAAAAEQYVARKRMCDLSFRSFMVDKKVECPLFAFFWTLIDNMGWITGDVDYDGDIDNDDYALIDSAFFFQGDPL